MSLCEGTCTFLRLVCTSFNWLSAPPVLSIFQKPERQQIALILTLLISMKWLDIVWSTANFADFELVIMKSKLHVYKLNLLALKETETIVQNILASDSFQCFKFSYII